MTFSWDKAAELVELEIDAMRNRLLVT